MLSEERLRQELCYTATDLERAIKVFDVLKLTIPNGANNPHWNMALNDLNNAKSRIANIQVAYAAVVTDAPIDLPPAAPAPTPL